VPSLSPILAELRRQVQTQAENVPGVYRFLGPRGEPLYVGKSVRLRSRLLGWLRSEEGKARELLRVTRGVEWEVLPSEFDALLREFRLIRELRPRFNVVHRRERAYAWIRITGERAPRLVASRRPGVAASRRGGHRGDRLIGPFPAPKSLPEQLRDLAVVCGVRDCPAGTPMDFADQMDLLASFAAPSPDRAPACVRGDFGSCPAPCAGRCTEARYSEGVQEAADFLEGRTEAPLERIREAMLRATASRAFEVAARARDRLEGLTRLRDRIRETREQMASLTFLYRTGSPEQLHLLREGQILLSRPAPQGPEEESEFQRDVASALRRPPTPPSQLSAEDREALFLVVHWFRNHPEALASTEPLLSLSPSQATE